MSKSTGIAKYSDQTGELKRTRYEPRDLAELKSFAQTIIQSRLCPSHIEHPADALLIMQRGAEMGITAVNALQNMYVVNGRVTMSAHLAVGICKGSPECRYFQCVAYEEDHVIWETHRVGNPNPTSIKFTKQDAQRAGLWGSGTWKKYPKNMMSARASINLARLEYPDLMAGIYTPEELGGGSTEQAPEIVRRPEPQPKPRDESIVDAEFEEAPVEKTRWQKEDEARREVRNRREVYPKSAKEKQAEEHAARSRASKSAPQAEPLTLEGESVSEKKAWATANAAIHAQAKGLNDVWYRAFHDYITAAVGAPNWNALTVKQLEMVLKRFKSVEDPVAWIKETCRKSIVAPDFKDASEGWRAVSELVHGVTKSNAERFKEFAGSICAKYDADNHTNLTVAQLQDIWAELSSLKVVAPNGGQGGEISEREAWLVEQVEKINRRDQASSNAESQGAFVDEEIPF